MKRSEMITEIEYYIAVNFPEYSNEARMYATSLLDWIEQKGMNPPFCIFPRYDYEWEDEPESSEPVNSPKVIAAIKNTFEKLNAMSQEEFNELYQDAEKNVCEFCKEPCGNDWCPTKGKE